MDKQRLYYQDPFLDRFSAQVTGCVPRGKGWAVTLDRTAFYPEGGGQPGDRGALNGVAVTDTREEDGQVVHLTAAPLEVGAEAAGQVDFPRRFSFMQLHSGEHMVSGLIHSRFGYDNVGFHMGSDRVTIDFNGLLDQEQLAQIEAEANRLIWRDLPVEVSWPDGPALAALDYRSKKELTGPVRIVTVPGCDVCACCGTHVARTGQIGLVKLLSCQHFRSGVRVEMLAGSRALDWLSGQAEENGKVSVLLSAKPTATADAARRLLEENQRLKDSLHALQNDVFRRRADELRGTGNALLFEDGLDPEGLRRLCAQVQPACGGRCAVFSPGEEAGTWRYAMGLEEGDLRPLVKALNEALCGRGGGKPGFVQGSLRASREDIQAFFDRLPN